MLKKSFTPSPLGENPSGINIGHPSLDNIISIDWVLLVSEISSIIPEPFPISSTTAKISNCSGTSASISISILELKDSLMSNCWSVKVWATSISFM